MVLDDDRVIGMITDRDLVVRALAPGLPPGTRVETVMSLDPVTVDADTPLPAALHAMRSIDARHLPVTEHGRLAGMVSLDDLLCHLAAQLGELAALVDAARSAPHTAERTAGAQRQVRPGS